MVGARETISYENASSLYEVTPRQMDTAIRYFLPASVNTLRAVLFQYDPQMELDRYHEVSSLLVIVAFCLTCGRCGWLRYDRNPAQSCTCDGARKSV